MADQKEVLGLDLDVTNFKEGIDVAKEGLSSLASGTGLEALSPLIGALGEGLVTVGVAALALKTTFDLVFDGDQIKRTDALFNSLATTFGVTGDAFKNDLIKAAGGMADTNTILDAANRSMTLLGENSGMIPKIMDLARKSTIAFGGSITERFQGLSMAIASGETRMLRANGIIIDSNEAMKKFASSIGITSGELSEAGKQQAIFNAVMDYSNKNLKAVNTDLMDSTMAWVQLKAGIKEAVDTLAVMFSNVFGPSITSMIKGTANAVSYFGNALKIAFGSDADKAAAQMSNLTNRLASLKDDLAKMEKSANTKHGALYAYIFGSQEDFAKGAAEIKAKIAQTESEIDAMKKSGQSRGLAEVKKNEDEKTAISKSASNARFINQEKLAEDRKKAQQKRLEELKKFYADENKLEDETVKLKQKNAADAVKDANSEESLFKARKQREVATEESAALERKKIRDALITGEIKDRAAADKKLEQIEAQRVATEKKNDKDFQKEHKAMLQNQLNDSKNMYDGIANSAKSESAAATESINDFGKQGTLVTNTFKNEGSKAFQTFGQAAIDHSQSASQIMKGFFLNSLADMAQAEGELFLAAGLGDPTKLVAGAALLALSGVLRSMAGSAGASGGAFSSGGAGGSTASAAASTQANPTAANATPTGNLTLNIQGDYLNTAETQRTLVQAIQNASDQTGYQFTPVGTSGAQNI